MKLRRLPILRNHRDSGHKSLASGADGTSPQAGFSLLAVIVALAIVGGIAASMSQMTVQSLRGGKAGSIRQDIETIKQTILKTHDCRSSLNVAAASALPMSCPSSPITLRRRNNTPITLGPWTLNVSCTDGAGGHLTVGISRPGADPVTGRSWSSLRATGPSGSTIDSDVFGGTEKLCSAYLDSNATCTGANQIYQGIVNGRPHCCRLVTDVGPAPDYISTATCNANEYIKSGGGSCHDMHTGGPQLMTEHTYMHTNFLDNPNSRWVTDCHAAQHVGVSLPPAPDIPSIAYALCCPR